MLENPWKLLPRSRHPHPAPCLKRKGLYGGRSPPGALFWAGILQTSEAKGCRTLPSKHIPTFAPTAFCHVDTLQFFSAPMTDVVTRFYAEPGRSKWLSPWELCGPVSLPWTVEFRIRSWLHDPASRLLGLCTQSFHGTPWPWCGRRLYSSLSVPHPCWTESHFPSLEKEGL